MIFMCKSNIRTLVPALFLAIGGTFFAACGGTDDANVFDACQEIEGRTYLSVEQYECGLGPDGPELCTWSISFANGEYDWAYSDIGATGSYTCDGAVITGMSSATQFDGFLDQETGILTWNSIDYQPAGDTP